MDEIDKKILQMLQENARYSLKKIAESTFLSSPAVSSRIGNWNGRTSSRGTTRQWIRLSWDITSRHM